MKAALALIIVLFCSYSLIGRTPLELRRDSRGWLLVCGFCAGVLGGAYGLYGPPLVIYGSMRRVVGAALSRHTPGIFFTCEYRWHGWVLADRGFSRYSP